jgi:hypothetical protein
MNIVVAFEALTAVTKSFIFWNITLCSPCQVKLRFGETYRLHLQGKKYAKQTTSIQSHGRKSCSNKKPPFQHLKNFSDLRDPTVMLMVLSGILFLSKVKQTS